MLEREEEGGAGKGGFSKALMRSVWSLLRGDTKEIVNDPGKSTEGKRSKNITVSFRWPESNRKEKQKNPPQRVHKEMGRRYTFKFFRPFYDKKNLVGIGKLGSTEIGTWRGQKGKERVANL